ncbi:MAG: hypothetical protein ABJN69_14560 [Hellea sp.]
MDLDKFTHCYDALPAGYSEGHFRGRRYSVRKQISGDGKRGNLVANELGSNDYISLNFYRLKGGKTSLKPCEMPEEKVIEFVIEFAPEI